MFLNRKRFTRSPHCKNNLKYYIENPKILNEGVLRTASNLLNRTEIFSGDYVECFANLSKNDFVYFDPPYGSNNDKMPPSRVRYASYYHIWTSIIKHDKPKIFVFNSSSSLEGIVGKLLDLNFLIFSNLFFKSILPLSYLIQNFAFLYVYS